VPSLIVTATVLLLVDNFTYTVFGWGIVDTGIHTAPAYWLLCIAVFAVAMTRPALNSPDRQNAHSVSFLPAIAAGLILASGAAFLVAYANAGARIKGDYHSGLASSKLPNIVMFASDGVNASHLSAYGYDRETTPNLDRYMDNALVAENAFTNAGWTTGSLTSMLTGKYPATTKVMYPPYTLKGEAAYQNMPRILHKLGYTNLQETVRYYADGPDLNWKDSFDRANGRVVDNDTFIDPSLALALQLPLMFGNNLYAGLRDRIEQVLLIKRMVNRYKAVTSKVYGVPDTTRMKRVFRFIKHVKQPFFIHIHLMGTHCCTYDPPRKVFSAGPGGDKHAKEAASFDNAILQSDHYFGELMGFLSKKHMLDHTLVIYSSDHITHWMVRAQVPLVFIFPHGAHRGHIQKTVQLLDVAPTILDYLNVRIPDWMEGKSLLRGRLNAYRPVFSVVQLGRSPVKTGKKRSSAKTSQKHRLVRVTHMGPPTYGLEKSGMVVCQRWYIMKLANRNIDSGTIATRKNKCAANKLPTDDQARKMMVKHLQSRGFVLNKRKPYALGTEFAFNQGASGLAYLGAGWSHPESNFTWTEGQRATLNIPLKKVPASGLKVTVNVRPLTGQGRDAQTVHVYVDHHHLTDVTLSRRQTLSFIAPKKLVDHQPVLHLTFKLPDAISPKKLGINGDPRVLALALYHLTISPTPMDQ
jgi:hypothetical protein